MRFSALPRLRAAALLLACASAAGGVCAQSATPSQNDADPVTRLLAERGLIDTSSGSATEAPAETGLRAQVREAASDMVLTAMNFLGVPYKRGGNTAESGFDCSGFTRHIFENSLGLVLPRRADDQATAAGLLEVKRDDLKPGDLVFFNTLRRTFSHVGIYIGEGKFIHSPRAGGKVRIEDMRFDYWATRFTGARRAPGLAAGAQSPAAVLSSGVLSAQGFPPGLIDTPTTDVPAAGTRPAASPRTPHGPRSAR
jgi:cell wall-associated NlpC family hydrolase